MDLEWIEDTPADEFEYGEEMRFSLSNRWIRGTYERQEGDIIYVRIKEETIYGFGMEDEPSNVGSIEGFHRDNMMNLSGLFTMSFTYDTWDDRTLDYEYTAEELEDEEDIYNPTTIGTVITVVKGKNHIDKRNTKPRDNPTYIMNIGDVIKKPKGRMLYRIDKVINHKFGDMYVTNINTGKKYIKWSTEQWIITNAIKPTFTLKKHTMI